MFGVFLGVVFLMGIVKVKIVIVVVVGKGYGVFIGGEVGVVVVERCIEGFEGLAWILGGVLLLIDEDVFVVGCGVGGVY